MDEFRQTGYVAGIFLPATSEQTVSFRLDRHIPAIRRPKEVVVKAATRFGETELCLYSTEYEELRGFATLLARPGIFSATFIGPWRVGYRQLMVTPAGVTVENSGTLAECFRGHTLSEVLAKVEGATPTTFCVVAEVEEAEALQLLQGIRQLTANKFYTGGEFIDAHLGDRDSQCGVTYVCRDRQLIISSESVALLSRCVASLRLVPIFGEKDWLAARVPMIRSRGEVSVVSHGAFSAGEPLSLEEFLREFSKRGD